MHLSGDSDANSVLHPYGTRLADITQACMADSYMFAVEMLDNMMRQASRHLYKSHAIGLSSHRGHFGRNASKPFKQAKDGSESFYLTTPLLEGFSLEGECSAYSRFSFRSCVLLESNWPEPCLLSTVECQHSAQNTYNLTLRWRCGQCWLSISVTKSALLPSSICEFCRLCGESLSPI